MKRKTDQERLEIVKAYHRSEATQEAFAAAHGLRLGKLRRWVERFGDDSDGLGDARFVEVETLELPSTAGVAMRVGERLVLELPELPPPEYFGPARPGPGMLRLPSSVKVFLAAEPTDMRKGFDGLAANLTSRGQDVHSGHLFVFVSRRGDRVMVLSWDRGGFVLWYKRLERGRFRLPAIDPGQGTVELDGGQLAMLLDGVDLKRVRPPAVWMPLRPSQEGIDRRTMV